MTTDDLFWLAINAYHEARGESDRGVIAVCWVVLTRASQRKMTVEQVVLQPWQFSWANNGARPPIKEYAQLARCLRLAQQACDFYDAGLATKADHYYADYIDQPGWAKKMQVVEQIGKHIFLKA